MRFDWRAHGGVDGGLSMHMGSSALVALHTKIHGYVVAYCDWAPKNVMLLTAEEARGSDGSSLDYKEPSRLRKERSSGTAALLEAVRPLRAAAPAR